MESNIASPRAGAEGSSRIVNYLTLALWTRQIPEGCQSEGSPGPGAGARAAAGQLCPAAPADVAGAPRPSPGPVPTGRSEQTRDFGTEGTIASQVPRIISRLCQANPIRGLFFSQKHKTSVCQCNSSVYIASHLYSAQRQNVEKKIASENKSMRDRRRHEPRKKANSSLPVFRLPSASVTPTPSELLSTALSAFGLTNIQKHQYNLL